MKKIFTLLLLSFSSLLGYSQCSPGEEQFDLSIHSLMDADKLFWTITDDSNNLYNYGHSLQTSVYTETFCLKNGVYTFNLDQTSGNSWTGTYSLVNSSNQIIASGSSLTPLSPPQFSALGIHPCQEINGLVEYNLPPDVGFNSLPTNDTIEICYDINLQANLMFPENNIHYNQSLTNINYLWEVSNPLGVSDGQTATTNNAYFTFQDHITYEVSLLVTDTNDCIWEKSFFVKNISPNTFVNVWADKDTICVGEITNIHTNHYNSTYPLVVSEPNPVFLDDTPGTGTIVEYVSTINISQFNAGDILDTNCISRVCATLEHSFVGDLSIFLELPNGLFIDFLVDHNGPASGNGVPGYLFGVPNDIGGGPPLFGTGPDLDPGTPFRYCWTPIATTNMFAWGTGGQANPYPATVVNTDGTFINDYAWDDFNGNGWDNAVGSSINGDWTIHIQDYYSSDNGFIFGWDFELCESPDVVYVDSFWVGNPATAFPNSFDEDSINREIVGVSTPSGIMNFEYHIEDNYGCEWVESIDILTWENPEVDPNITVFCQDTARLGVNDPNTQNIGAWTYLVPPGGVNNVIFSPNEFVIEPLVTVPELGEYQFIYTSECGSSDTQIVIFESQPPVLSIETSQECNFTIDLVASNPIQNGIWTSQGPSGEVIIIADSSLATTTAEVSNYGEYTFTYTYEFCDASFSQSIEIQSVQPVITNTQTLYICDKSINLSAILPSQAEQWSVEGPGVVTFSNFQSPSTSVTVSEYGDYTFFFDGCGQKDTLEVVFERHIPVLTSPTYVKCGKEALIELSVVDTSAGNWSATSETGAPIQLTEINDNMVSVKSDSYGEIHVTYSYCDTFSTVDITFMCELDIPNVFTPNNDPLNPVFSIKRLTKSYYDQSKMIIYNKWGTPVYENGNYGLEGVWWDGKDSEKDEILPEGVYYYKLQVHNRINDLTEDYHGIINLFR